MYAMVSKKNNACAFFSIRNFNQNSTSH